MSQIIHQPHDKFFKRWNAPHELFDLFGEHKELAKKLFLRPYTLIDVHRISDQELKKHQWIGAVEFVLKYRRSQNSEKFLKTLFQWLNRIEIHKGSNFIKIVLKYIADGVVAEDEQFFIQKANQYLSKKNPR